MQPLFSCLPGVPEQYLPTRGTLQAAGCDLFAYLPDGPVTVEPCLWGEVKSGLCSVGPLGDLFAGEVSHVPSCAPIRTGVRAHMRECHWGAIYGRSSLRKVGILSDPGVIDADYTGELIVLVRNLSRVSYTIRDGDKIAQFIVHPRADLGYSVRAADAVRSSGAIGGFGSTGR